MQKNCHFQTIWPAMDGSFKINCLSNVFSLLPVRLVQMRTTGCWAHLGSWNPARCEDLGEMMLQLGLQLLLSILTQPQGYIHRNSPSLLFSTALKHLGFSSFSAKHKCHCPFPDLFWEYCEIPGLFYEGLRWGIMGTDYTSSKDHTREPDRPQSQLLYSKIRAFLTCITSVTCCPLEEMLDFIQSVHLEPNLRSCFSGTCTKWQSLPLLQHPSHCSSYGEKAKPCNKIFLSPITLRSYSS